MDKRNRPADRRNRSRESGVKYETISLILDKTIFDALEKAANTHTDNNLSHFIEHIIPIDEIKVVDKIRQYKAGILVKKTLSLTCDFTRKLRQSGNMSLAVEEILRQKLLS